MGALNGINTTGFAAEVQNAATRGQALLQVRDLVGDLEMEVALTRAALGDAAALDFLADIVATPRKIELYVPAVYMLLGPELINDLRGKEILRKLAEP